MNNEINNESIKDKVKYTKLNNKNKNNDDDKVIKIEKIDESKQDLKIMPYVKKASLKYYISKDELMELKNFIDETLALALENDEEVIRAKDLNKDKNIEIDLPLDEDDEISIEKRKFKEIENPENNYLFSGYFAKKLYVASLPDEDDKEIKQIIKSNNAKIIVNSFVKENYLKKDEDFNEIVPLLKQPVVEIPIVYVDHMPAETPSIQEPDVADTPKIVMDFEKTIKGSTTKDIQCALETIEPQKEVFCVKMINKGYFKENKPVVYLSEKEFFESIIADHYRKEKGFVNFRINYEAHIITANFKKFIFEGTVDIATYELKLESSLDQKEIVYGEYLDYVQEMKEQRENSKLEK